MTILRSGALPAPVDIIEERTVGPSLGEASIRAGFISVTVGLLLVVLHKEFLFPAARGQEAGQKQNGPRSFQNARKMLHGKIHRRDLI